MKKMNLQERLLMEQRALAKNKAKKKSCLNPKVINGIKELSQIFQVQQDEFEVLKGKIIKPPRQPRRFPRSVSQMSNHPFHRQLTTASTEPNSDPDPVLIKRQLSSMGHFTGPLRVNKVVPKL